jgi:hypothetical protein
VSFKNVEGTERPVFLTSPETTIDVDNLEIDPRRLYSVLKVPITSVLFPWDRYPNVQVSLRYRDAANNLAINDTFMLTKEKANAMWTCFILDPKKTAFEYKVKFFAADNRDIERDWATPEPAEIILRDPRGTPVEIEVLASGFMWDQIDQVFVDVAYDDPASGISVADSLEFNAQDHAKKTVVLHLGDAKRRPVKYSATIVFKNGRIAEVPPSFTFGNRIIITGTLKGHRVVEVKPAAANFADRHVRSVIVELRYDQGGMDLNDTFEFDSGDDQGIFEYDVPDQAPISYQFRVTTKFDNGMVNTSDWQESKVTELKVPVG